MVNKHVSNQKMNQKQLQYLICLKSGQNPLYTNTLVNGKYNFLLLDTNPEVICLGIELRIVVEAIFSK